MKKFSSFAVVKQVAKEKMGKAESQVESPEALATKDQLSNIKAGYKAIASGYKNYTHEGLPLAVSQGEIVAEALLTLGAVTIEEPLAHHLKNVGHAQREMDNHLMGVCTQAKDKMYTPTQLVIDTDIKRSTELKGKQETSRLKYDAAMTDLKQHQKKGDASKLQKAEEETQKHKISYDQATAELTEVTHHLVSRVDREMTAQLREYAQAQVDYFRLGAETWEKVLAQFEGDVIVSTTTTYIQEGEEGHFSN